MINLLPQHSQNRIVRVYQMRLATTILFLVAFTLLSAVALLMPSYIVTLAEESSARERMEALDIKIEEKRGGVAAEAIATLNHQLSIIDSFKQATTTSEVLEAVHSVRTPNILIHSFSFEHVGGQRAVILTGVATTRDALHAFTQELMRLPVLSEVSFPVSNLAEARNNNFTITATLTAALPTVIEGQ
jgi:hypothetical protein